MRIALLRCPELLAVECWVSDTEIKIGILIPNPRQPPPFTGDLPSPITLYDTSTQPPTPYPVLCDGRPRPSATEPSYRITLPRSPAP